MPGENPHFLPSHQAAQFFQTVPGGLPCLPNQTGAFLNNHIIFFLLPPAPQPTPLEFRLTATVIYFFVSMVFFPVILTKTETWWEGPCCRSEGPARSSRGRMRTRLDVRERGPTGYSRSIVGCYPRAPGGGKCRTCLRTKEIVNHS